MALAAAQRHGVPSDKRSLGIRALSFERVE